MPLGPIKEKLIASFGDKVQENVLLAPMTTFRIGGPADLLFTPADEQDLQLLMGLCAGQNIEMTVIGGGSNLLVADGGIRGITIWMTRGFRRIGHRKEQEAVLLECGASLAMSEVLDYCIEHGLAGFEFASGIPGTLGGAVKGNAGTKDGAIGDVTFEVAYVNQGGALITLPAQKLRFRYRGLDIEGRFIITRVVLRLREGHTEKIREKRDRIVDWRRQRQPWDLPSAGSIFINPEGGSAGRLIEEAGCKGMKVGGAQVSEKHANFIVNTGGARAADVLELIEKVRRCVFERHGVLLETEIQIVGEGK